MKKQVLFISQTSLMLALLIVIQLMTRGMSQFITGPLVNMVLLVTVFTVSLAGGIVVALLSPFLAFLIGIGPAFIQIVLFVSLANTIFVTVAWLLANKFIDSKEIKEKIKTAIALLISAITKTTVLWIGLVQLALPYIPGLKPQQQVVIASSFSWPQLITALVGGALAWIVIPIVVKATKK